jgi:hypothetical protein
VTTTFRTDRSKLGRFKPSGFGALAVPANLSRTGIQIYTDSNGKTIREYRPPEEVFHPDSLASFKAAPLTILHPKGGVNPSNSQKLTHGIVLDAAKGEEIDGHSFVQGLAVLTTSVALQKADAEELEELSVGYHCEVDQTPGVAPNGEHYDAVQRNIRVNHVALLPKGHARAGKHARLRTDGNEEVIEPMDEKDKTDATKVAEELGRVKVELEKANGRADAAELKVKEHEATITKLEKDAGEAKGRQDALEAELKPFRDDATKREIDELVTRAAKTLGDKYDTKDKTAHQVRVDALTLLKVDVKDRHEGYVEGMFEGRFAKIDTSKPVKRDYNRPTRTTTPKDDGKWSLSNAFAALKHDDSKPATKEDE